MSKKTVLVVGAGNMGAGIAQLCAQQGFEAVISDVSLDLAARAKSRIERGLQKRVDLGKLPATEKEAILSRISAAGDLGPAGQADFVHRKRDRGHRDQAEGIRRNWTGWPGGTSSSRPIRPLYPSVPWPKPPPGLSGWFRCIFSIRPSS